MTNTIVNIQLNSWKKAQQLLYQIVSGDDTWRIWCWDMDRIVYRKNDNSESLGIYRIGHHGHQCRLIRERIHHD